METPLSPLSSRAKPRDLQFTQPQNNAFLLQQNGKRARQALPKTSPGKLMHITTPKDYYCFTPLVADFDNDGWPDIYVACDSTASLYFHNLKGQRFEEIGVQAGVAQNQEGREQAGMGVAAADFTHDRRFDIFKTNFTDDTPTLFSH